MSDYRLQIVHASDGRVVSWRPSISTCAILPRLTPLEAHHIESLVHQL